MASDVSEWCDRHPSLLFALLSAWYLVLVWKLAARPLWFDELTTFYIARQPTMARMMEALRTVDLNPPLNYFLTRWSIALLGTAPWATRLPALIAFWGGSAAIFALLRRRASALVAATGVLLFWSSPYFSYAAEARPYGLMLGLSAILLWAWDPPANGRRNMQLVWVAIVGGLLLLSHLFGVLSLVAVWIGEGVRSYRRRKVDWPMAAALLFPIDRDAHVRSDVSYASWSGVLSRDAGHVGEAGVPVLRSVPLDVAPVDRGCGIRTSGFGEAATRPVGAACCSGCKLRPGISG